MLIPANHKRDTLVALSLGAAAFIVNLLHFAYPGEAFVPFGTVFLLIAASSLGTSGAIIACSLGLLPLALIPGQYFTVLHLILLCGTVSWIMSRTQRVPAFLITLGMWLLAFGPALALLHGAGHPWLGTARGITYLALQETLMTVMSGAFLLNQTVWGWITGRPRHIPAELLLSHVLTITSTMAILLTMTIVAPDYYTVSAGFNLTSGTAQFMLLALLGITLPPLLSLRLAHIIARSMQQMLAIKLMPASNQLGFSGLSSDYWRRNPSSSIFRSESGSHLLVSPEAGQAVDPLDKASVPVQGICALNRNGTICFVNRKFRHITGMTMNDVLGKNIEHTGINPDFCRQILDLLEYTFTSGPRVTEMKLNELPDKLRYYELTSQQSEDEDESSISNGPDSVIISIKDITDRRTVESHLLQAQKLKSLGEVITGIAHSFNNSLTEISGQASFALHAGKKDKMRDCLDEIMKSADKAGGLVHKLLDYAQERPAPMKTEELSKIVREHRELLSKMLGESSEIICELPADPISVCCDTKLIMQALTNVALNARESYGDKPGEIRITLDSEFMDENVSYVHAGARAGHYARLRVHDKGCGMSNEILSRAFDPMFSTKVHAGHSGLGLSIVFAIMRAHNGFLSMESHPEKGTTVSLYFPLADEAGKEYSAPTEKESIQDPAIRGLMGHQEKILVVEDEPCIRDLIARMLSALGYEVTSCADGYEALEQNGQKSFDLIIADMVMPRMNGLELLSRIREAGGHARTMIMTGYGSGSVAPDVEADVLSKPFDLDTLGRRVKESLNASPAEIAEAEISATIN